MAYICIPKNCHKWHYLGIPMIIKRDTYLNLLIEGKHNGLIKVITGLRRSGKSYLLFKLFRQHLKNQNVDDNHIIDIDLEDRRNIALRNPDTLLVYIITSSLPL